MNSIINKFMLSICFVLVGNPGSVSADIISTLFASNNGQAGNMFDLNVLSPLGIEISQLDLNLDPGSWDIELYTRAGTHVGNENDPSAWTLLQTTSGVTSVAPDLPTPWDVDDFTLANGLNSIYINVTNGTPLNYTNGTGVGNLVASNASVEIFEGTGNAANFGTVFSPRIFNGNIVFEPITLSTTAIPEPGSLFAFALLGIAATNIRLRRG